LYIGKALLRPSLSVFDIRDYDRLVMLLHGDYPMQKGLQGALSG
jgi:hypothetical protein